MKRLLHMLLAASMLASCASLGKEMRPYIDAYLVANISHPETYAPGKTDYLGEARMVRDALAEFPCGDTLDVRVFVQHFVHAGRDGKPRDGAYCFYFAEDNSLVLAHNGDEPIEEGIEWKE